MSDSLNGLSFDAFTRLRYQCFGSKEASPFVVEIEYDDESIFQLGSGVFKREYIARLIDELHSVRVKAIVLGFVFYGLDEEKSTDLLVQSMQKAGNVFSGVYVSAEKEVHQPSNKINHALAGFGHINAQPDADGVLRHLRAFYPTRGGATKALPLLVAEKALGVQINVPLKNSSVLINYPGPRNKSFMRYSVCRILNSSKTEKVTLERELSDAIVVVSESSKSNAPLFETSFGEEVPSSHILAANISSFYSGRTLRQVEDSTILLVFCICALLVVLSSLYASVYRPFFCLAFCAVLLVLQPLLCFFAFIWGRVFFPVGVFSMATGFALLATAGFKLYEAIAERKALSQELQRKEALAELGEKIAGLSHNMKGMVELERSYAQLALHEKKAAKRDLYLQFIQQVSAELFKTVASINYLSRSKSQDTVEEICLNQVLSGLTVLYGSGSAVAPIEFSDCSQTVKVTAVPLKLVHAFENLLVNALDACKERKHAERKVWIALELLLDTGMAVVSIKDSGTGIAWCIACGKKQKKCLDCPSFKRGHTTKPNGSGFGLVSARQTFAELSGSFTIESSPQGTCVRIGLPCVKGSI